MARALVTGGAGFIGSHLVERLCAAGHAVRVVDDLSTGKRANLAACDGRVEFTRGDIRDEALIAAAVRDVDWVFHLAADVSVPRSVREPQVSVDVNVRGTAVVAYAAAAAGASRFVFASSCAVYGETGPTPVAESTPPRPLSPYGASKLMAECLLGALHRSGRMPALSCRFFNVYGPRQSADSQYSGVVAQFIDRARKGEPLCIYGDGEQTRDFVEVSDVVDLLVGAAARDPASWPEVANVGTGAASTIRQLADCVRACVSDPPDVLLQQERRGDLRHSCADVRTVSRTLGWTPRITLRAGIEALWGASAAPAPPGSGA